MTATQLAEPTAAPVGPGRSGSSLLTRPWTIAALVVAALTVVGIVIRLVVAQQSLFADELATYWDITSHGFRGLISALYNTHIEITPPLFFIASWVTAHLGHTPLLLRLPSLIAGAATIPAVYLLGTRTVGRTAALVAAALTAFSPFMIYYSTEARAYGLMMLLVTLSTLSLLLAIDTRRARWWIAYAVCTCAAFYTHYTALFYLAAQFVWVLWACPEARRHAIMATIAAGIGALPWTHAFINAGNSPTEKIMSNLAPFTVHSATLYLSHWSIGYPYASVGGLNELPGTPALILLGLAGIAVVAGLVTGRRPRWRGHGAVDRRLVLVVLLLLSAPVGEAIVSATGDHILGTRNLAAAWPPLALAVSALALSAGPRLRFVAAALLVASVVLGSVGMLGTRFQRPDYRAAASFVQRNTRPGDVVIDNTGVLSPGPLTGLDVALHRRLPMFRSGAPQESDHPFTLSDRNVSLPAAIREAVAAAGSGRILLVSVIPPGRDYARAAAMPAGFPGTYRLVEHTVSSGIVGVAVQVYARRPPS
jgi:mannosyltransferase